MNANAEELREAGFRPFEIDELDRASILQRDVFDYLFTILDHMEHTALLVKLREKARELGVARDFDTMYKAAQASFIQQNKQAGSNVIKFTDCPLPGLKCGKWECTDFGVTKQTLSNGLMPIKVTACSHPILPVERLTNLDTGTEKIKLAFYKDGRWQDITVDRSQVANKSNIVQLADRGIEVTSENAKDLVSYIADVVALNIKDIPVHKSISRLGWVNDKFAPYVDGIKYDGDIAYKDIYEAVRERGDYEEWKALCKLLRKRKVAHIMLATSFASPLIEPLGILPFVLHIWGGTGVGKTVGLMLAMSVWGDPEMGKLVRSLNATQVSLGRTASFLYSIPFAGDELQIIKNRWDNFDQLIMFLTEGIDRGRGKAYGGIEDLKQWRCCFMFSGEEPITKSASGGGAKNRVIEIECTEPVVEDGNFVSNFVRENFGYAGRIFIENLPDKKDLQEQYREIFRQIVEQCDTTDKQAMAMAAILLADKLAAQYIFQDDPLQIDDVKDYLQTKADIDVAARAYEWTVSWITRNSKRFTDVDNNGEIWGKLNLNENYCMVLRDVLDEQLGKAGFDYSAVIRKWAERGQIERNSQGRYYHHTKVSGIKGYYTKIMLDGACEFDNADEMDLDGDELPF